jgi:hypothetical protein
MVENAQGRHAILHIPTWMTAICKQLRRMKTELYAVSHALIIINTVWVWLTDLPLLR